MSNPSDWASKDFYKALGVSKDASTADVKKAYRKLARENHPDSNPGNKAAEDRFKGISEAYAVLSSADKRKEYDEQRSMFGQFRGGGAGGVVRALALVRRRRGGVACTSSRVQDGAGPPRGGLACSCSARWCGGDGALGRSSR